MSKDWFKLSLQKVKKLFNFYLFLSILGLLIVLPVILFKSIESYFDIVFSISLVSILGGIGTSLCGSTIFYIRKLYKSCIKLDFQEPVTESEKIQEIGVWSYFIFRPFYAVIFSILIHISLKEGVEVITMPGTKLGDGFIYLSLLLSFFGGFAVGGLITNFQTKSKDFAEKAFNKF